MRLAGSGAATATTPTTTTTTAVAAAATASTVTVTGGGKGGGGGSAIAAAAAAAARRHRTLPREQSHSAIVTDRNARFHEMEGPTSIRIAYFSYFQLAFRLITTNPVAGSTQPRMIKFQEKIFCVRVNVGLSPSR
ncbi:hypothetical protein M0802_003980 [Mischocyttarus mexicanus]|nr:hypothetical protein M0802_003980 [Mischocyttarus mexicanus]